MMVVPARITRHGTALVIEILQSRTLPFVEQDVHQAWDRLFDGQRGICPAELGADPSRGHHHQRMGGRGGASGEAAHEHIQRSFTPAIEFPLAGKVIGQTPWPEDITPSSPCGLTACCRRSITRIGARAFVSITW